MENCRLQRTKQRLFVWSMTNLFIPIWESLRLPHGWTSMDIKRKNDRIIHWTHFPALQCGIHFLYQKLSRFSFVHKPAFHYLLSCQFHLLHRSDSLQNPASSAKNLKHPPHYDQIRKAWTPIQAVPHLFHSQHYPTFSEIPHISWVFLSKHPNCRHLSAWLCILWYISHLIFLFFIIFLAI